MTAEIRETIRSGLVEHPGCRLTAVVQAMGLVPSAWYRTGVAPDQRKRPGPPPRQVDPAKSGPIVTMAIDNPWYGYRRIAVMCRRAGHAVNDREAYRIMKREGLLQRRPPRKAELHQAAKLFELLPKQPNELWQMDVTYVHIPAHGWWYAVTVIDYFSRYLLACYLTHSYSAVEVSHGLKLAREEAERIRGPLGMPPFLVTDNGSSFLARKFQAFLGVDYSHVRIAYRTPQQLGLLERFHGTLKKEEVYWQLYDTPGHARECLARFHVRYNTARPHWALIPETGGDPLVPAEVYAGGRAIRIPRWQPWAIAAKAKLESAVVEGIG